jgi:hypothetical protein
MHVYIDKNQNHANCAQYRLTLASAEGANIRRRAKRLSLALLVISLLLLASLAIINLTQTNQSNHPTTAQQTSIVGQVSILTNRLLFFGSISVQGRVYRFSEWNVTLRNNSNDSARITATTFVNGQYGGGFSSQLSPLQTYSNVTFNQAGFSENETYSISVFAFTSSGLQVLNSTATTQVARQVAEPGAIAVDNNAIVSSVYSAKYNTSYSEWTLTVTNSGTKSIALLAASLSNSTGNLVGFAFSYLNGNFLDSNKSFAPFPTVTRPMSPGQSATLFAALYPRVSNGSEYKATITALYTDGTQSTTKESIVAP